MPINVNHAANSSVNCNWETKQACTFRKANSFMRKPHAGKLGMTPMSPYPETFRLSRGKEANKNKKKKKKTLLKVTPLKLFDRGQAARREHIVALVRVSL